MPFVAKYPSSVVVGSSIPVREWRYERGLYIVEEQLPDSQYVDHAVQQPIAIRSSIEQDVLVLLHRPIRNDTLNKPPIRR